MVLDGGGPLLIALHGLGETRTLDAGARGWKEDYLLGLAHARLRKPPLKSVAYQGLVSAERLAEVNAGLKASPYQGLTVVCPFTPNLMHGWTGEAGAYARFLFDELVPAVGELLGRDFSAMPMGIDGVSLGGRVAWLVGLSHPKRFATVSALQPAFRASELASVVQLAREAVSVASSSLSGSPRLRLVTSERDHFRPTVEAIAQKLRAAEVGHEMLLTQGPHDYVWNQGPGGVEMLLWHDRALRAQR